MGIWTWTPSDVGGPLYRQIMTLAGRARKSHAGTFSIPNVGSAPAGTNISVTGVGFRPQLLITFDAINNFLGQFIDDASLGVGMTDGINQWAGGIYKLDLQHVDGNMQYEWYNNRVTANAIYTHLVSFDSDGFTLQVDDNFIGGADNLFAYLALRGGGDYACGTELSPSGTGVQSITSDFEPTGVILTSVMAESINTPVGNEYTAYSFGMGDVDGQYNAWTRETRGDIYTDMVTKAGKIMTFGIDSDLTIPFEATELAQAELASFDPTGFTLDWTLNDGIQRYFSWVAFSGRLNVDRLVYDVPGGAPYEVPFDGGNCSRALISFANSIGDDTISHNTNNAGCGMSFGVCDMDDNQFLAGYGISSEGSFSVQRAVRQLAGGYAFGSYERRVNGVLTTMPNSQRFAGTAALKCVGHPQVVRYR